ncbi:MAG: ATP-dependent Clp protease ATP-binding subunit [Oscillospiraceae bacterium]|nr:ATP-dependent Clp protease ATP-binding subunit [Oscillospiraceae bacterium]
MVCTRCRKRMAVVFITTMQGNEKHNEGLCLVCAKELGVPQVSEYIKQMGLSEEDFEESYKAIFGDDEIEDLDELMDDDIGGFKIGGAGTMPQFLQNLFRSDKPSSYSHSQDKNKGRSTGHLSELFNTGKKDSTTEDKKSEKKYKFLDTFCTNLTARAKNKELDKIIGREREINRVTQILSRRTKNNPCLIGEPGVGKTAIAEGIAQRLVEGNVPFRLQGKQLYMLDLTALVAGTQFRGQFESRVKSLIEDVKKAGNVLLFIDEVHNIVGAGDSDGTMNAANMFKPALSRGDMQVIGATTFGEYRKHIEKDSALERRFQPVTISEPNIEETVELLKGIKKYYEQHHKIVVSDEILQSCAVLSERYINDRFLPDKAIDLLDEAAACASIKSVDLAEYERLFSECDTLQKEESAIMTATDGIVNYERIAQIKTKLARNEERIKQLEPLVKNINITDEDLSNVIELWTGIPSAKIMETEFNRIGRIEQALKEKVIGQDEACALVASAIRRSRVQLSARRKPASFIFVGPTGVGKTELVKVLADELFSSVEPLIRLDMSEYMEKHSVSRIIGSPPGYIGYDEAGQLTEKVRRRPYSVILFDEIEKAHPDVMNILLQILDEGKVNDAHGRAINFENTVIAMTSNAGSTDQSTGVGFAKTSGSISKDKAMKALKEFLRPEFMSRVDEVVVFEPLTEDAYRRIAELMVEEMREPLMEKHIELLADPSVYSYIGKKAYGGKFGGRDIRRIIRKELEDEIAILIIQNGESGLDSINLTSDGERLYVSQVVIKTPVTPAAAGVERI